MAPTKTAETEPLWMEAQAAKQLNVSARTLQNWRTKEIGPSFVRAGRMIRYRPRDLLDWIEANTICPTAAPKGVT